MKATSVTHLHLHGYFWLNVQILRPLLAMALHPSNAPVHAVKRVSVCAKDIGSHRMQLS